MMCGMVRVWDYVPPVTCGLQVPGRRTAADSRRSPKMLRAPASVRRASDGRDRGGRSACEQRHASRQAPRPNPVPSPTWPGASPHLIRAPPVPFGAPRRPSLPSRSGRRAVHPSRSAGARPKTRRIHPRPRDALFAHTRGLRYNNFRAKMPVRHARYQGYKYYGTSGGAAQCRLKTSCARTTATARSSS